MLFTVSPPIVKWQIGGVVTPVISAASLEVVRVPVFAASGGVPVNPTTFAVSMAFISGYGAPASGDWKAATWDNTNTGQYVVQCLVGTGGAAVLSRGAYYCWIKIVATPETVVEPAGEVRIF